MSLKGCIKKAGKALDKDDRNYMRGLIEQGRPDNEIVNRLQQNIIRERDEVVGLLKDQGVEVKEAGEFKVSEGTLDETEDPEGGRIETKAPEESLTSTALGFEEEGGLPPRANRQEGEAKPSQPDAPSSQLPAEENAVAFQEKSAEERAANVKKNSNVIAAFIAKVAPKSPMLMKFIKNTKVLTGDMFDLTEAELKDANLFINFQPLFSGMGAGDNYNPAFDTIFISGKGLPDFPIPEGVVPDQRVLDLNKPKDLEEQVLIVEHEVTHAYTIPYIEKVLVDRQGTKEELANMDYLDNALIQIENLYKTGKMNNLSPRAIARVEYFLNQPSLALGMSEFVAIMTAETEVANEIYRALSGKVPEKTLRARIGAVIDAIKASFLALTEKQLAAEIDAEALQQALLNVFVMGKSMRETKADEFAVFRQQAFEHAAEVQAKAMREMMLRDFEKSEGKEKAAEFRESLEEEDRIKELSKTNPEQAKVLQQALEARFGMMGINSPFIKGGLNLPKGAPPVEFARKASFDYLNYAVSSMINARLERKGKQLLGNLHDILNEKFPLYTDAANKAIGIYDGSPALQQFIHTVTGENVNKLKKADTLAKFAEINAQKTEIINDQVSKLVALSQDLTDGEKADLDVFISQMPLHDYFVLAGDLSTAEEIEAKAELLRKKIWRLDSGPRAIRDAEQIIDWNIGKVNPKTGKLEQTAGATIYNLDTKYPLHGEFGEDLRQFLALESIKRYGTDKFIKLLANKDLMDTIRDNSVANAISTLENEGTSNIRDSLIMDYWKEPIETRAVLLKDFRMYEFGEETGWKVLKAPTRTELGIVYKPTIDSTDIAGAYTDTKLSSTDINVDQSFKKFPGVVETRNGYKLLLTKEQKIELGLIQGFEQGLVRSTAHSIAAKESEIIRNSVLQDDTWMEIGQGRSESKLVGIIESDNVDNPWFIKLEEGTEYNKLDKSIRAKYMPVGGRASNVRGFNDKVDLVRKDISHWLLGGSAKSLFQNPQMKWALRILKNLVSGSKIGMIVLNPVKIANDNLSNLTYLGVLGLDPLFIAKNYAEIQKDFAEYSDLQRQIWTAKLQLISRPESTAIQKKLKSLQKRLAANSVGDIGDKGFVNSLGSDLVSRSADTLSGFQADMHKALEYLLTDKAGNRNVVSHFVMELQKVGYQAEDFFGYLGDIASRSKNTALLQQELDQVADRLREIKSEEDIVNYVAQFTTSPSSEAVRFGSAMTDLTDVMAKETLYRYLVQEKNMSPEDARINVLDSFPDYKENMPLSIKALSDVGIVMFPSFWLRIQKIIYRMARDKPVNLATELMIQEMLGTDINTIFEANVINKSETFGGLFHPPFESAGLGSVVPLHVFP